MLRSGTILCAASLLAGCSNGAAPALEVTNMAPGSGLQGEAVPVVVTGTFVAVAVVDWADPGASRIDARFILQIGGMDLRDVALVDAHTLRATVPGTLAPDTYALTVTSPGGASATLPSAFTVVSRSINRIAITDAPNASGQPIVARTVPVGQTLALYAAGYDSTGAYSGTVDATWSVNDPQAMLGATTGPSTTLDAAVALSATVTAAWSGLTATAGPITFVACGGDPDCDDGDVCDGAEQCVAGACRPGTPVVCTTSNPCLASPGTCAGGTCDFASLDADSDGFSPVACGGGDCADSNPVAHPGAPEICTGGIDDDCNGLVDAADPACTSPTNTRPTAAFTVQPNGGDTATAFAFDASASSDAEDPPSALVYDWDWEGDGTWDASMVGGATATHVYAAPGIYSSRLRVTDTGALSGYADGLVVVGSTGGALVVTSAADSGTGTLRAALTASAATTGAVIAFAGPMTIALGSELPSLEAGQRVVGQPGVVIDGSALLGARDCLTLNSAGAGAFFLEIRGCARACVRMTTSATNAQVAESSLHDCGSAGVSAGWAAGARIGPHNDIFANGWNGISGGPYLTIDRNQIRDNPGPGMDIFGTDGVAITGSVIARNALGGVSLNMSGAGVRIANDLFLSNGGPGLTVGSGTGGVDLRNTIFSGNTGAAVSGAASAFSAIDYVDDFMNGGSCSGGCAFGPNSVVVDPMLVAGGPAIAETSPLRNRGDAAIGYDANGAFPGNFCEAAPEIGAYEICP